VGRRTSLQFDCPVIRKHRAGGDERAFFHVGHRGKWVVCGASEAGTLSKNHLYGLVLHEFGHPMAWSFYGRSEQEDADRAILDTTGVPILYRSGLIVQWITGGDVGQVCRRRRTLR
jgi:hypothetical protein